MFNSKLSLFLHNINLNLLTIGGMYPELITRPDLKVYLPPIGGISVYIFGNPEYVSGKVYIHSKCD